MKHESTTKPMNEWGFTGYETLVVLGLFATNCKFKQRCSLVLEERILLSIPTHHS